MTPQEAAILQQMIVPQIADEIQTTRKILAAVPDEQAAYKPHEKNMSALELAQHIALVDYWFLDSIIKGSFAVPEPTAAPELKTASAVAAFYETQLPPLVEKLKSLQPEQLATETQFYHFNMPLAMYLGFMLNHSIHHRGQLSVYLRPMGAKVPSIYGGSADEPMAAEAAAQA